MEAVAGCRLVRKQNICGVPSSARNFRAGRYPCIRRVRCAGWARSWAQLGKQTGIQLFTYTYTMSTRTVHTVHTYLCRALFIPTTLECFATQETSDTAVLFEDIFAIL